jgi:hypothetical protein
MSDELHAHPSWLVTNQVSLFCSAFGLGIDRTIPHPFVALAATLMPARRVASQRVPFVMP